MTTSEYIAPGMVIKIVNPYNSLSVPIEYTVIGLRGMYVDLRSKNGERSWALLEELVVPPERMYVRITA
jgi:hypothetical protein